MIRRVSVLLEMMIVGAEMMILKVITIKVQMMTLPLKRLLVKGKERSSHRMFHKRMKYEDLLILKINNVYDKFKNYIFVFLNSGYNIT